MRSVGQSLWLKACGYACCLLASADKVCARAQVSELGDLYAGAIGITIIVIRIIVLIVTGWGG